MLQLPRMVLRLGSAAEKGLAVTSAARERGGLQQVRTITQERDLASFREASLAPLVDAGTVHKAVPADTKALLDIGDAAIAEVRQSFPFGAGNTVHDLTRSRGRAFDLFLYARSCSYPSKKRARRDQDEVGRVAAIAQAAGGGACGEYVASAAATLNRLLPPGVPINVCHVAGLDHEFVVLGDLATRDRSAVSKKVVVDAWVPSAQALLAEDYKFLGVGGELRVEASFSASGRDLVRARVPHVRNASGAPPAAHEPPRLWDGVRFTVWTDTHATRGDVRIVYEGETPPEKGRTDGRRPRAPEHEHTLSGGERVPKEPFGVL